MARIALDVPNAAMGSEGSKTKATAKPAVDYVDGKGWVDEDGKVVEPETGKARNRRALELVDDTMVEHEAREKEARIQQNADDSVIEDMTPSKESRKTSKVSEIWRTCSE